MEKHGPDNRVPASDYSAIEPGTTELVAVERMAIRDLYARIDELERRLDALHAECGLVDTIRYRRREREQMEARAAMAAIGRLAPDERAARVRAMSTAELALFWSAIDDATVLDTMRTLTAEERASHLMHVRLAIHDKVRLIDEPAPERVRIEMRDGVRYRAPERRVLPTAAHAALKKAGLASWLGSDGQTCFVKCINPPSVLLRVHFDALIESGDPASEFITATPLDAGERDAFHLDELRRERDQMSRPHSTVT